MQISFFLKEILWLENKRSISKSSEKKCNHHPISHRYSSSLSSFSLYRFKSVQKKAKLFLLSLVSNSCQICVMSLDLCQIQVSIVRSVMNDVGYHPYSGYSSQKLCSLQRIIYSSKNCGFILSCPAIIRESCCYSYCSQRGWEVYCHEELFLCYRPQVSIFFLNPLRVSA